MMNSAADSDYNVVSFDYNRHIVVFAALSVRLAAFVSRSQPPCSSTGRAASSSPRPVSRLPISSAATELIMKEVALSPSGERQREVLTVTVGEALRLVGIGRTRLYELIGSGQVTTVKIGRRRLVHLASLKTLVSGMPALPSALPATQLPLFGGEREEVGAVGRRRRQR
jgi:excisionase family DNA binding protein